MTRVLQRGLGEISEVAGATHSFYHTRFRRTHGPADRIGRAAMNFLSRCTDLARGRQSLALWRETSKGSATCVIYALQGLSRAISLALGEVPLERWRHAPGPNRKREPPRRHLDAPTPPLLASAACP